MIRNQWYVVLESDEVGDSARWGYSPGRENGFLARSEPVRCTLPRIAARTAG